MKLIEDQRLFYGRRQEENIFYILREMEILASISRGVSLWKKHGSTAIETFKIYSSFLEKMRLRRIFKKYLVVC